MDLTGHVHLLLSGPGPSAPVLPPSPWRLWTLSDQGPTDPVAVAAAARPSPMTARAERALLAAVAADDVDALGRLAATSGGVQEAARVLHAIRLVDVDAVLATETLIAVLSGPADPATSKVLHRHWGGLSVGVTLAPGVPALVPLSRTAVGLLLAEVCTSGGRRAEAVAVLRQLPPHPSVLLALVATLLAAGEHEQVIEATTRVGNLDDTSALVLVGRSVAARSLGDLPTALDAATGALSVPERRLPVLAAAVEERARVHTQAGDEAAARADLEALTALTGGAADVTIPTAAPLTAADTAPTPEDDDLHRARDRVRRRIMGVGAPGTFGGRHHSTYRDDVADMFALGQADAVEELLLGLLDAVEDEVAETGAELDPTFFLTLVDLYEDSGRTEDLVALRERFAAAQERARHPRPVADEAGAGEGPPVPAPFDAPPPAGVDAVSIDGRTVDVDAAVEHLLVSVGVAPARGTGEEGGQAASRGGPSAVVPQVSPRSVTTNRQPEPEPEADVAEEPSPATEEPPIEADDTATAAGDPTPGPEVEAPTSPAGETGRAPGPRPPRIRSL